MLRPIKSPMLSLLAYKSRERKNKLCYQAHDCKYQADIQICWPLLIISSSPFKGTSCSIVQGIGGSYSQGHFNIEVKTNPLILAQSKLLRVQDFPNIHSLIKKTFSGDRDSQCISSRKTQIFCKELARSNNRPSNYELCGKL